MRRPAIPGPMSRPAWKDALLSPTAFGRSSTSTISETNACLVGLSKAATTPSSPASRYTCHSRATSATTSRPSTSANTPDAVWVAMSSRRRSSRSATAPLTGASSSTPGHHRPEAGSSGCGVLGRWDSRFSDPPQDVGGGCQ